MDKGQHKDLYRNTHHISGSHYVQDSSLPLFCNNVCWGDDSTSSTYAGRDCHLPSQLHESGGSQYERRPVQVQDRIAVISGRSAVSQGGRVNRCVCIHLAPTRWNLILQADVNRREGL